MNKCMERDIQEMLPDLLHRTLAADERRRVEAHLATCEQCKEDLEVLRAVKAAAVFVPAIDVDRVVRQIPPYRTIVPEIQLPARPRFVSWLVAASLAIVVLGGGSLLLMQPKSATPRVPVVVSKPPAKLSPASGEGTRKILGPVDSPKAVASAASHTHALALAADVEGLSDTGLRQLMNDMDRFDGLPASEPEPVISVDSGDNPDQDTR